MKRALTVLGIGLLLLIVLAVAGLRIGAAWLVGTDEFRQRFNDMLEHGMRSVLTGAMTEVGRLELTAPVDDQGYQAEQGFDPTRITAGIELSDDLVLAFRAHAYEESRRSEGR